jgi:hypothetical protein
MIHGAEKGFGESPNRPLNLGPCRTRTPRERFLTVIRLCGSQTTDQICGLHGSYGASEERWISSALRVNDSDHGTQSTAMSSLLRNGEGQLAHLRDAVRSRCLCGDGNGAGPYRRLRNWRRGCGVAAGAATRDEGGG